VYFINIRKILGQVYSLLVREKFFPGMIQSQLAIIIKTEIHSLSGAGSMYLGKYMTSPCAEKFA
jgi:hypothetical protein